MQYFTEIIRNYYRQMRTPCYDLIHQIHERKHRNNGQPPYSPDMFPWDTFQTEENHKGLSF